ncbi:MAG: hypothetical protein PVJ57_07285 [Phycisphaerae bacterium]|jgi:hypothetical protein
MAKSPELDEDTFQAMWKTLPLSDKRFLGALILITEAVGDEKLRYHELPARLEHTLREADRDTLFSLIAECLGHLLNAPAMERVRRCHRRGRSARLASKQNQTREPRPNGDGRPPARGRRPG